MAKLYGCAPVRWYRQAVFPVLVCTYLVNLVHIPVTRHAAVEALELQWCQQQPVNSSDVGDWHLDTETHSMPQRTSIQHPVTKLL
jgi:hypothetical protein